MIIISLASWFLTLVLWASDKIKQGIFIYLVSISSAIYAYYSFAETTRHPVILIVIIGFYVFSIFLFGENIRNAFLSPSDFDPNANPLWDTPRTKRSIPHLKIKKLLPQKKVNLLIDIDAQNRELWARYPDMKPKEFWKKQQKLMQISKRRSHSFTTQVQNYK